MTIMRTEVNNSPVGENWTHLTLISGLVLRELKSPGMEFRELDDCDDLIIILIIVDHTYLF